MQEGFLGMRLEQVGFCGLRMTTYTWLSWKVADKQTSFICSPNRNHEIKSQQKPSSFVAHCCSSHALQLENIEFIDKIYSINI